MDTVILESGYSAGLGMLEGVPYHYYATNLMFRKDATCLHAFYLVAS